MKKSSWALLVALVALIIAISSFFVTSSGTHPTGSTAGMSATAGYYVAGLGFRVGTEQSYKTVFNSSGQLTLSTVGSAVTGLNFGTCYVRAYAATIAASSSGQVDCSASQTTLSTITGVTSSDKILAQLSTTTASKSLNSNGIWVTGVTASTTNGYITLTIANGTGGTFTWDTTSAATGTVQFLALR